MIFAIGRPFRGNSAGNRRGWKRTGFESFPPISCILTERHEDSMKIRTKFDEHGPENLTDFLHFFHAVSTILRQDKHLARSFLSITATWHA
jgi:hypothetical protein